jgi:hypothetical protein
VPQINSLSPITAVRFVIHSAVCSYDLRIVLYRRVFISNSIFTSIGLPHENISKFDSSESIRHQ